MYYIYGCGHYNKVYRGLHNATLNYISPVLWLGTCVHSSSMIISFCFYIRGPCIREEFSTGGLYLGCVINYRIPGSVAAATITEVRRLFEGGVYSARRTFTVSRHAPSAHVNFVLGLRSHLRARWLTLSSSLPSSPFHQRFVAIMSTWRHICAYALQLKCGYRSRAATYA